jgi:hypothetical protein
MKLGVPTTACVLVAMLSWEAGACLPSSNDNNCNCPAGNAEVVIQLPCGSTGTPAVTAVGLAGCTADQRPGSPNIFVDSDFPGTCHVTWTYPDGSGSSTDIVFTPIWEPCGSDPHGCGQGVTSTPSLVQIGNACADSGVDAGSPDVFDGGEDADVDARKE